MPAVKIIERLDLEQNRSFLDRHYLMTGSQPLKPVENGNNLGKSQPAIAVHITKSRKR